MYLLESVDQKQRKEPIKKINIFINTHTHTHKYTHTHQKIYFI
jgi:hypothetical protein